MILQETKVRLTCCSLVSEKPKKQSNSFLENATDYWAIIYQLPELHCAEEHSQVLGAAGKKSIGNGNIFASQTCQTITS